VAYRHNLGSSISHACEMKTCSFTSDSAELKLESAMK
jgi:hypothetical protein